MVFLWEWVQQELSYHVSCVRTANIYLFYIIDCRHTHFILMRWKHWSFAFSRISHHFYDLSPYFPYHVLEQHLLWQRQIFTLLWKRTAISRSAKYSLHTTLTYWLFFCVSLRTQMKEFGLIYSFCTSSVWNLSKPIFYFLNLYFILSGRSQAVDSRYEPSSFILSEFSINI